jgi:hypothetical protein
MQAPQPMQYTQASQPVQYVQATQPAVSYASPQMISRPAQQVGAVMTETRQPVMIDQRSYQRGVEDIRTVSPYGVSDTYIPVNIQTDTYTPGQLVTDTVRPVYA